MVCPIVGMSGRQKHKASERLERNIGRMGEKSKEIEGKDGRGMMD